MNKRVAMMITSPHEHSLCARHQDALDYVLHVQFTGECSREILV